MKMTTQQKTEMMGTEKVWKVFAIMAFPSIMSQLSHTFYNLVDRFFMGQYVGSTALGAISLTSPLINIMAGLSLLITIGGAALLSINLGKGKIKDAQVLFTNLIVQALVTSFVLALVYFIFAPQIITICGAGKTSSLYEGGVKYLRILSFGLMFQLLNAVQASIIRAEGNAGYSLVVSIIGGVVNIVFDAVLVIVFRMGVAGAAYATVASQFVSALVSTLYFFSGKSQMKWTGMGSLKLSINIDVIKTGMAPAILQLLSFITGLILNNQLRKYGDMCSVTGDLAISAMSVVTTAESVFLGVVMGINQAVSPIVSYNYGAGKYKRVLQGTIIALITGTIFTTISWALMMFVPQYIFKIFSNDVALISYGVHAIRLYRAFSMFMAVQTLCAMFFSSIGEPKTATVMSVLRQGVFLIPGYLILPVFYGLDGVLFSMSISDVLSTIIILVIYILGLRKLEKKRKEGCYE